MELYKCKQQVMALCNYRNDCDGTYNSTDCMCYRDNKILMPDTADKVKIKSLQAKYEQLQQKYTQAMELLGLADGDMQEAAKEETGIGSCIICEYGDKEDFDGPHCWNCTNGNCKFIWRHADKLEELRGGKADEM